MLATSIECQNTLNTDLQDQIYPWKRFEEKSRNFSILVDWEVGKFQIYEYSLLRKNLCGEERRRRKVRIESLW